MTLEQKIRNAIPELQEATKGCVIKSKYYGLAELIHYDKEYFNYLFVDEKLQFRSDNEKNIEIIGKPIQLNHVLEYLLEIRKYSITDLQIIELINRWNLKSKLLSNQSPELKNFINELA